MGGSLFSRRFYLSGTLRLRAGAKKLMDERVAKMMRKTFASCFQTCKRRFNPFVRQLVQRGAQSFLPPVGGMLEIFFFVAMLDDPITSALIENDVNGKIDTRRADSGGVESQTADFKRETHGILVFERAVENGFTITRCA